jgi:hypothetical protein
VEIELAEMFQVLNVRALQETLSHLAAVNVDIRSIRDSQFRQD